jgi:hypothetical protein
MKEALGYIKKNLVIENIRTALSVEVTLETNVNSALMDTF